VQRLAAAAAAAGDGDGSSRAVTIPWFIMTSPFTHDKTL
jgi:UDP-N-acetylglucosamine pyrophosphorylase